MATLLWSYLAPDCLQLFRDEAIKEKYGYKNRMRENYMKESYPALLHFSYESEYSFLKDGHTTPIEMRTFFGIDDTKREFLIDGVNPWLCFTENGDLVLYFGEDKPILKTKTVKGRTRHRRFWQKSNNWFVGESTYYYWKVNDKTKLLICSTSIMKGCFPELKTNEFGVVNTIENGVFRCSDEYDYTEDEKREIRTKQIQEEQRKRAEKEELERRKNTDGFCSCCGSEHASLVTNPFEYDVNGRVVYQWLCPSCYNDIVWDI